MSDFYSFTWRIEISHFFYRNNTVFCLLSRWLSFSAFPSCECAFCFIFSLQIDYNSVYHLILPWVYWAFFVQLVCGVGILSSFCFKSFYIRNTWKDSHLLAFPLLALSLNLQKFTLWTNRLSNQLALSLKMEFKQLENAVFHFFNINTQKNMYICKYIYIIYLSIIFIYVCVLVCMSWHLASSDFLQNVIILYVSKQPDPDTFFCHVRNISFAFKHFPGSSSSLFLLI